MAKRVQHVVLETDDKFTVEYICMVTGRTKITQYDCPLTKAEIEAEYPYVSFPVSKQEPKPEPTMEEVHFKGFIDYLCRELKTARHKDELLEIIAWAKYRTSNYKM